MYISLKYDRPLSRWTQHTVFELLIFQNYATGITSHKIGEARTGRRCLKLKERNF